MTGARRSASVLTRALLVALFGSSTAEAATPNVSTGDRVRVTAPALSRDRIEGRLAAQDAETLTIVPRADGSTLRVPRAQIARLEVARGKKSHLIEGVFAGIAGGVVLGAAACGAMPCQGHGSETRTLQKTTLLGAAAGAFVGTLVRTDRWTTVPATFASPAATASSP